LAILFADALRAAGVAARVAGTPAWKGKRESGNHNWVEVLDDDHVWKFMEPSPAQKIVDDLERDPCQRWFCIPDRYPASLVYAARLDQTLAENTFFRLAWEWNSTDVPGIDRTDFYSDVCNKCIKGTEASPLEDVPTK
jgi:transglutaminase-like putative cysteine protease